jgi:hypothetical protein
VGRPADFFYRDAVPSAIAIAMLPQFSASVVVARLSIAFRFHLQASDVLGKRQDASPNKRLRIPRERSPSEEVSLSTIRIRLSPNRHLPCAMAFHYPRSLNGVVHALERKGSAIHFRESGEVGYGNLKQSGVRAVTVPLGSMADSAIFLVLLLPEINRASILCAATVLRICDIDCA